jgi:hypothetical protein
MFCCKGAISLHMLSFTTSRRLQVLSIEGRSLLLGGADVVDGSPVLDIKPFLPFADAVPGATAPGWVKVREACMGTAKVAAQLSTKFSCLLMKPTQQAADVLWHVLSADVALHTQCCSEAHTMQGHG